MLCTVEQSFKVSSHKGPSIPYRCTIFKFVGKQYILKVQKMYSWWYPASNKETYSLVPLFPIRDVSKLLFFFLRTWLPLCLNQPNAWFSQTRYAVVTCTYKILSMIDTSSLPLLWWAGLAFMAASKPFLFGCVSSLLKLYDVCYFYTPHTQFIGLPKVPVICLRLPWCGGACTLSPLYIIASLIRAILDKAYTRMFLLFRLPR